MQVENCGEGGDKIMDIGEQKIGEKETFVRL